MTVALNQEVMCWCALSFNHHSTTTSKSTLFLILLEVEYGGGGCSGWVGRGRRPAGGGAPFVCIPGSYGSILCRVRWGRGTLMALGSDKVL